MFMDEAKKKRNFKHYSEEKSILSQLQTCIQCDKEAQSKHLFLTDNLRTQTPLCCLLLGSAMRDLPELSEWLSQSVESENRRRQQNPEDKRNP